MHTLTEEHQNGHSTNGNGNGNGSNGNGHLDNVPPAVRARTEIATSKILSAGAKFFGGFLVDCSFCFRDGGDGHGRVTIGQRELVKRIHHDRKTISKWVRELNDSKFLRVEKFLIPNARPANIYCLRGLIPDWNARGPLGDTAAAWNRVGRGAWGKFSPCDFSAENPDAACQSPINPPAKAQKRPLRGGENGTCEGEKTGPARGRKRDLAGGFFPPPRGRKRDLGGGFFPPGTSQKSPLAGGKNGTSKETPSENRRLGDKGGGENAPPEQSEGEKELRAWIARLPKLFPRELRELESKFKRERQTLSADPANKKPGDKLRTEISDLVEFIRKDIDKHEREKLPAEDLKARVSKLLADPKNYQPGPLTPHAAAQVANLTRKIAAIDKVINGPK